MRTGSLIETYKANINRQFKGNPVITVRQKQGIVPKGTASSSTQDRSVYNNTHKPIPNIKPILPF